MADEYYDDDETLGVVYQGGGYGGGSWNPDVPGWVSPEVGGWGGGNPIGPVFMHENSGSTGDGGPTRVDDDGNGGIIPQSVDPAGPIVRTGDTTATVKEVKQSDDESGFDTNTVLIGAAIIIGALVLFKK